jgi:hypothetical protein
MRREHGGFGLDGLDDPEELENELDDKVADYLG